MTPLQLISFLYSDISYTSVTGFLPNLCQFYPCKEVDFTKTQLTGTVPLSIWTNVTLGLYVSKRGKCLLVLEKPNFALYCPKQGH
jgi:hypothetical protein